MLRLTLTAMPSSQGRSDPPSGSTLARSRQASRNVSETASSAVDQLPVSRNARLYTAREYSSNSRLKASESPTRTRARKLGSIYLHCPPATSRFPSRPRLATFPGRICPSPLQQCSPPEREVGAPPHIPAGCIVVLMR